MCHIWDNGSGGYDKFCSRCTGMEDLEKSTRYIDWNDNNAFKSCSILVTNCKYCRDMFCTECDDGYEE